MSAAAIFSVVHVVGAMWCGVWRKLYVFRQTGSQSVPAVGERATSAHNTVQDGKSLQYAGAVIGVVVAAGSANPYGLKNNYILVWAKARDGRPMCFAINCI